MSNQNNWICPEDGAVNSGNYCTICGRQRPKYAAQTNSSPSSKPSGNNLFLRIIIGIVVFIVCYSLAYGIASSDSPAPSESAASKPAQTSKTPSVDIVQKPEEPVIVYTTEPSNYQAGFNWDWEEVRLSSGNFNLNVSAAAFDQTLYNVKELTVIMDVSMNAGTSCKDWQVWLRQNGSFVKTDKIYLPNGNGSVTQTLRFSSPATFDAIAITPTIPGGYSWSMSLGFSDFYFA